MTGASMLAAAQTEVSRLTAEVHGLRAEKAAYAPTAGTAQIAAPICELQAQIAHLQAKQQEAAQQHAHEVFTLQEQFQKHPSRQSTTTRLWNCRASR